MKKIYSKLEYKHQAFKEGYVYFGIKITPEINDLVTACYNPIVHTVK